MAAKHRPMLRKLQAVRQQSRARRSRNGERVCLSASPGAKSRRRKLKPLYDVFFVNRSSIRSLGRGRIGPHHAVCDRLAEGRARADGPRCRVGGRDGDSRRATEVKRNDCGGGTVSGAARPKGLRLATKRSASHGPRRQKQRGRPIGSPREIAAAILSDCRAVSLKLWSGPPEANPVRARATKMSPPSRSHSTSDHLLSIVEDALSLA